MANYTLKIEAVSCDELYADITAVLRSAALTPEQFAAYLRQVIVQRTRCCASIGMGPNLLTARLSTKRAKPDGAHFTSRQQMNEFIMGHQVKDLPGVGRSIAYRLNAMDVHTCAHLQQV